MSCSDCYLGWGMTETTGAGTLPVMENKPGAVGKVFKGTEIKVRHHVTVILNTYCKAYLTIMSDPG